MNWSRRLSRENVTLSGKRLRTLADARAFMSAIKGGRERRERLAGSRSAAAGGGDGGSVAAVTGQLLIALLNDGPLDIARTAAARRDW